MMGRRALIILTGITTLFAAPTVAGPVADLREWQYRRAIVVSAPSAEFGEIVVDGSLHETAVPGFRDVRITSADGELVPYVIREWPASTFDRTVPARTVNRSVIVGRLTRLEVHATATQPHNRLQVEIGAGAFSRRVVVEGSDDRQRWLVLASAILVRTTAQATAPLIITYPDSTYRYVRLSLLDQGEPPLQVIGAALILTRTTPAREDTWYTGAPSVHTDPSAKRTALTVDLTHQNLPMGRVTLQVARPGAFVRSIIVDISNDGQHWQMLAARRIARTSDERTDRPLLVSFPEGVGRYLRLTIVNGDNPPLDVGTVEIAGIRRTILFPVGTQTAFWLYVGAPAAPAVEYDLEQVLSLRDVPPRSVSARLGPSESNPTYVPLVVSRPWTEERPWLLWSALAVSVIVILGIIAATLRGMRAAS